MEVDLKVVFILTTILFLFTTIFFYSQNKIISSKREKVEELTRDISLLLKELDIPCRASSSNIEKFSRKCVKPALELKEFKEEEFRRYEEKEGEGFVILKNKGTEVYDSKNFTLLKNKEKEQKGCHIKGEIERGYTCKLFFHDECKSGDVLEVQYKGQRVFLKNC